MQRRPFLLSFKFAQKTIQFWLRPYALIYRGMKNTLHRTLTISYTMLQVQFPAWKSGKWSGATMAGGRSDPRNPLTLPWQAGRDDAARV